MNTRTYLQNSLQLMLRLLTILGLLTAPSYVALAQARVSAGQTWAYQFTSLPLLGVETELVGGVGNGGAHLTLSNIDPGTHYIFSIYEDSLSEAPIFVTDSMVNQSASGGGKFIWQDLQGWAQVQVITGALTIDQIQFDARIPIDATHDYAYESIIAVPKPVPIIQMSPLTQTVEAGTPVDLRVRATGSYPLFYKWYLNKTNLVGDNTNYLQLANLQLSQSDAYTVVVTNAFGAVTSSPALLNVIAPVSRRPVPAITLIGQPNTSLNLQYSDVLFPVANWSSLASVSMTNASQMFADVSAPLLAPRFYRAWQQGGTGAAPRLDLNLVTGVVLTGTVGSAFKLDYINQVGPIDVWVNLATVTLPASPQLYLDYSALGQPARLYRIIPMP